MAIPQHHESQPVSVHELAATLAEMVRDEPLVLRMWVSSHGGVTSFWLLTPSIDSQGELRLYGLSGDLFDRFPGARFRMHLMNPHFFEDFHLDDVLPSGAEEIPLRAA